MKSIFKILGVIVLAVVIGLSMTACDDSGGGGGNGGNNNPGNNNPGNNNPGSGNGGGGNNPGGNNPGNIVPNELIGTFRVMTGFGAGDSDYDIIITSTTLTWSGDGPFNIKSVTSSVITIEVGGTEFNINYVLNGNTLRVQDGSGEWQERERING